MTPRERDLSAILCVDVETTCWPTSEEDRKSFPDVRMNDGEMQDIIQIGVAELVVTPYYDPEPATIRQLGSLFCRPERSEVNEFCTYINGITSEKVAEAAPFAEQCLKMRNVLRSRERIWASWGDFDRRRFEEQCRSQEIGYPFSLTHWNVKSLYAIMQGLPKEVPLGQAVKDCGMYFWGTPHDGLSDAVNVARVLMHIFDWSEGRPYYVGDRQVDLV